MVSIMKDFINKRKEELLSEKSLESYCYYYLANQYNLTSEKSICFPVSASQLSSLGEEDLSILGYTYKNDFSPEDLEKIKNRLLQILKTTPMAGMHYSSNIFTLMGIYLLAEKMNLKDSDLQSHVDKRLIEGNLKDKFLLSVPARQFNEIIIDDCKTLSDCLITYFIRKAMTDNNRGEVSDNIIEYFSTSTSSSLDLIDIFLIEYWLSIELKDSISYKKYTGLSLILEIIANFPNSITKITKKRRKDHELFEINNEYDVQDVLYVMLKTIFSDLKEEDTAPKVGGKSTRIDLVIPSEDIVIETKMIKGSDSNEDKFIREIKEDIQSYYKYPNIKWLVVFVYDPLRKTRDDNNFYDLNGIQKIKDKEFEVIVKIAH